MLFDRTAKWRTLPILLALGLFGLRPTQSVVVGSEPDYIENKNAAGTLRPDEALVDASDLSNSTLGDSFARPNEMDTGWGSGGNFGFAASVVDASGSLNIPKDQLDWHLADPELDRARADQKLEEARQKNDRSGIIYIERLLQRVETIRRPNQTRLTLEETLHRTLANNYLIEVERFNPAMETTRVVEAEAAFDAVFFTDLVKNVVDRPSGSQLASSHSDLLDIRSGIRKVLPSGTTVSASYGFQRTNTALSFQQINPEWFNDLQLEMRQPFLRGFGLDYNRSVIRLAKNDHRISHLAFARRVRDTLRETEELYWRLVQARRDVVITARLLAEFEGIYDFLVARQAFDITPVQLSATKANLESARADFVRVRANVFDAEDRLVSAMNDPEMNLAADVEIIPTDFPPLVRLMVDPVAEAQTGLDRRPEIREQQLRVASAKILIGRAKNEELPRLDLTFRYTIDGLGRNADSAFDQLTMHRFVEYLVGVSFEVPVGNRSPRAVHRRAQLQHSQAIAQLKATFEQVLLDINLAVRNLTTSYDQIGPSFEAAQAREREVDSIVARAERKDLNTLNSELGSRQALASSRRAMLQSVIDYNIAIIDLERAKGTLLQYNNVMVPEDPDQGSLARTIPTSEP
ncbi:MAG: TolC family protein [Planctomycetota bacterium]